METKSLPWSVLTTQTVLEMFIFWSADHVPPAAEVRPVRCRRGLPDQRPARRPHEPDSEPDDDLTTSASEHESTAVLDTEISRKGESMWINYNTCIKNLRLEYDVIDRC